MCFRFSPLFFWLLYLSLCVGVGCEEEEPSFVGHIENVTVALGREAILACTVDNIGKNNKVGWLKAEDHTILSLQLQVVTHNSRISVTHDNHRVWRLHIRQLKESDRGCYMCQINTSIMKKQVGCIDVHVPPDIVDSHTSSDLTVEEGDNATLVCKATGRPQPRIIWRREDFKMILIRNHRNQHRKVESVAGESLMLTRVERTQMGAYLCIASNDVPPAVSKRITLNVNFAPVVKVANQLLGAPAGSDVTMTCHIEAYPYTVNYWMKNRGQILLNGPKHTVEESRKLYKVNLRLTVKRFDTSDAGTYVCVATNSLGKSEGAIRLYELKIPTTTKRTTTTPRPTTTTTLEPSTPKPTTHFYYRDIEDSTLWDDDDADNEIDPVESIEFGVNSRRRSHHRSNCARTEAQVAVLALMLLIASCAWS